MAGFPFQPVEPAKWIRSGTGNFWLPIRYALKPCSLHRLAGETTDWVLVNGYILSHQYCYEGAFTISLMLSPMSSGKDYQLISQLFLNQLGEQKNGNRNFSILQTCCVSWILNVPNLQNKEEIWWDFKFINQLNKLRRNAFMSWRI